MIVLPEIDPVAFRIGMFPVRWYGLMYLAGFVGFWWLGRLKAARPESTWKGTDVEDLLFYGAVGVIVGGRLGYVLFYDLGRTLNNPWILFQIWKGGMSFHGGLLGVAVAMWIYSRFNRRAFFSVTDFIAPLIPLGLAFGRIGNFINGELWGKASDLPWAMVFPYAGPEPRHPSQLYQALLEGLALFLILWVFSRKPRPTGAVTGVFLCGYGIFRIIVEFVRVPDDHLAYLAFEWVTMGQVLSVPMIVLGIGLLVWANGHEPNITQQAPVSSERGKKRRRQRRIK